MQAAAAVSANIKPAPTAAAAGPTGLADALASLQPAPPAGEAGPAGDHGAVGGDDFAQALAALAGLPIVQPIPAPTTPATPPSGDATAATTASTTPSPALAAAFGASLLQAIPAPAASGDGQTVPIADASATIAIPAALLAQARAQAANADVSIPPPAPAATGGAGGGASAKPTAPASGATPASAPIIVGPAAAPTPAPAAATTGTPGASVVLAATPVSLVATTVLTGSAIDGGQTASPAGDDNAADPAAASALATPPTPPTPPRPAPAPTPAKTAGGKTASPPDQADPSAPDTTFAASTAKPAAPAAAGADAGHGDHGDANASGDGHAPAPATTQAQDPSLIAQPLAAAQVQATVSATPRSAGSSIVGQIADQVIKSVDGKSTRFDVALNPAGLGQVNVKVEINAAGQVSAALSFDNPHAAAEARAHAGELQQALEQAGFNLGQGGLSFDVGGQGASLARQDQGQGQPFQAPPSAFTDLADAADATPAALTTSAASGVNILI